jgi:hypothetical protein
MVQLRRSDSDVSSKSRRNVRGSLQMGLRRTVNKAGWMKVVK